MVERANEDLTLRQLASKSGVSATAISEIERGKRHAHAVTLAKIARGLGIPVERLLEETTAYEAVETASRDDGDRVVYDLSDAAGTAYMDRVQAGRVEEVHEDEELFFDQLGKLRIKPGSEDLRWSVEGYERNLAQGLAALAVKDREEAAQEIRRVLRRMRKLMEAER